MVRKLFFVTVLVFFLGARFVTCAFGFEPFQGKVIEDNINVRSDSTVLSALICNLSKPDQIEVIAQSYDWYKIRLPHNAPSFIKNDLLSNIDERTAKVLNDRVNIRLAPDKSAPIVGQVNKGEVVNIILRQGEWARIVPVNNSFGWIHKRFVVKCDPVASEPSLDAAVKTLPTPLSVIQPLPETVTVIPVDEIKVEGYVHPYGRVIKRQATHKIISLDNQVFLLKGNRENLNSLTYHKARVSGKFITAAGSKYPVIEVSKMEVME